MRMKERRMISFETVVDRTSLSRATIYRQIRKGTFPRSRKVTGHKVAFVEAEVNAWLDARAAS